MAERTDILVRAATEMIGFPPGPCRSLLQDAVHEIERLRGENAHLQDAVVAAAELVFGPTTGDSAESYASENLYTLAKDLVDTHPRLAGAFPSR